jgi:hypothetical protein
VAAVAELGSLGHPASLAIVFTMIKKKIVAITLGVLGVVAAIFSLFATSAQEETRQLILAAWVILPPIYFWLEYYFLCDKIPPKELEEYKMFRELSRDVWAGIAAALAVAYFKG